MYTFNDNVDDDKWYDKDDHSFLLLYHGFLSHKVLYSFVHILVEDEINCQFDQHFSDEEELWEVSYEVDIAAANDPLSIVDEAALSEDYLGTK